MRRVKLSLCLALAALGLALSAGGAFAASQGPAVDCNDHGYKLTHHYTRAQLEHALATMPTEIKEYTPCYQVITSQLTSQINGSGGGSGSGGSGSSFLSAPLIIVLVVIVLAGGGLAYVASRRNSGGGGPQAPAAGSSPDDESGAGNPNSDGPAT
jgi:hypothetical protein